MMELRPYQREAVDAVFDYWRKGGGNPLIDLATGTGKSLVLATIIREAMASYPDLRVMMLVHVRELVQQNAQALLRAWPGAPLGINSAGLGRRDKRSAILYASIQSVAKEDAYTLGKRDLIIVDESHLIPRAGNGQYQTFIAKMRESVPDLRVIGLTATPFRLDSGRLDEGDVRLFDDTVYSYDIARGVTDGYLCPLVSRETGQVIDVRNVKKAGGEFIARELETAVNKSAITNAACDEIIQRGVGRNSWLVFCAGVEHSLAVREALRLRGVHAEMVTGQTEKGERDRIFSMFKAGKIKALCGVNVFSTGFDAPNVDLIAMLRPTLSTSLYVQQLGRGTRLNAGKSDCLVLDFAENVRRHGPVDAVEVKGRKAGGDGTGKVTVDSVKAKPCPKCETLVSIRSYTCTYCGHEWPQPEFPKHKAQADTEAAVMSREIVDRWLPVTSVAAYPHRKENSPTSMRVEYQCGLTVYKEWVTVEHPGFPGAKAARWWRSVIGTQAPVTTAEAIARITEAHVQAITIQRDGKFWRVTKFRVRRSDGRIFEIDEKMNVRPVSLQLVREAS